MINNVIRLIFKDKYAIALFSFFIGGLTNYIEDKKLTIMILSVALSTYILFKTIEYFYSKNKVYRTSFEKLIVQPNNDSLRFVNNFKESKLVVGKVVELSEHPELNSRTNRINLGWDAKSIEVNYNDLEFDSSIIEELNLEMKKFDPDKLKFCLTGIRNYNSDDPSLSIELKKTKFSTVQTIKDSIINDPKTRHEYGQLSPAKNRIPHILCLHFIVELADSSFLMMKRTNLSYYRNKYSFSAEEQMDIVDYDSSKRSPIEHLFQRALCEEIFPLLETGQSVKEDYDLFVKPHIENLKIWSIFIEEELMNFTFLGYCKLNLTPKQFVTKYREILSKGYGNRDYEGKLFRITEKGINSLLLSNSGEAYSLFTDEKVTISSYELHPTTRYRMFRIRRAMKKDGLELNDLKQYR